MTVATKPVARLLVLLGILLVSINWLGMPGPAYAHGGPYDLMVSADGAGGIVVTATYSGDSHPVDAIMDPAAIATSSEGETVGPVSLVSSSEGEGVWVTPEPVLSPGSWSVTVTTTVPEAASATVEILVEELAPPKDAPAAGADGQTAAASGAASGWLWGGAVVLVLVVIGGWIGLARRTRKPRN